MTSKARENNLDQFKDRIPVLLASLKSMSVGLNLVQANHVVMFDMWWNPAIEEQAIGRVHRMGQIRPVYVTKLIIKGTVEEKIQAMNERKVISIKQETPR